MATTTLGKVSVTPKGQWSSSTAYEILDIVTNDGSSYIALKTVPAGTALTNTEYWQNIAEKGDMPTISQTTGTSTTDVMSQNAVTNALAGKVNTETGKGLSTNDYTTAEKEKLAGVEANANNYSLPVAGSAIGGVKSGTDITVDSDGNVSVNDDSHNHIISNVDGLQDALDAKEATANKVTSMSASSTDTQYPSAKAVYTEVSSLNSKLDDKVDNVPYKGTTEATYTRRTSGGTDSIGSGTASVKSVKGNTIVWNQLINLTDGSYTSNGITFVVSNGVVTCNGTSTDTADLNFNTIVPVVGHKVLITGCPAGGSTSTYYIGRRGGSMVESGSGTIVTLTDADTYYRIRVVSGQTLTNVVFRPQLFDLTQMFGSGNEPSTVAEFRALFPLDYYAYNAGTLLSFNGTGIKTDGFNQWDEEWESGSINSSGGTNTDSTKIRSKNFIPVFPSTGYYFKSASTIYRVAYYDINKNFISGRTSGTTNNVLTMPSNCYYIKFAVSNTTTYNHDICINLSWTAYRNGEYESYWSSTLVLPISTYFANGMRSAGSVYDELTPSKAITRIGSRAYQSGDENDTSVITDGTTTYYALDTATEQTISPALSLNYPIDDFGTETLLPENISTPTTSPIICTIGNIMNVVDTLRTLDVNYENQASMDALLTALGTALGFTWSKTYNTTYAKYNYTITMNSST